MGDIVDGGGEQAEVSGSFCRLAIILAAENEEMADGIDAIPKRSEETHGVVGDEEVFLQMWAFRRNDVLRTPTKP